MNASFPTVVMCGFSGFNATGSARTPMGSAGAFPAGANGIASAKAAAKARPIGLAFGGRQPHSFRSGRTASTASRR